MVELDFRKDDVRLSVSDDGIGLPDDYAERGHGFANMRADAERLGGNLVVEPQGARRRSQGDLRDSSGPQPRGGIG